MKRVIQFSKVRYIFFAFSLCLFAAGVVGYIVNGGVNLGVDYRAGLAQQFQIAPASFTLQYSGTSRFEVTMPTGEQALTAPGDFIVVITDPVTGARQENAFKFSQYQTVADLLTALNAIPGMSAAAIGSASVGTLQLLPPVQSIDIAGVRYVFNAKPSSGGSAAPAVAIGDIRDTLASMGKFDLQVVGAPADQKFIARFESSEANLAFQQETQAKLTQLLGAKYGPDQILLISSAFVEPRMSQALASQSVWLAVIAMLLILIYLLFRFRPAIYAVAAVLGVLHDAIVILAFDAVFKVEIDAGTVAAILTILGYSINDTIVIFDRVRENTSIMRGSTMTTIMDTSFSQNLGRTFITSGATMLTVLSLFILTTGTIHTFSYNMLVGLIEGTYSTFISTFIALEWLRWTEKRKKAKEAVKYGVSQAPSKDEELEEEEPEGGAEIAESEAQAPQVTAQAPSTEAVPAAPQAEAGAPQEQGKSGIVSFPGGKDQGYRYLHKRHKRRHH
jgi:preprotein translocase subunit SecF